MDQTNQLVNQAMEVIAPALLSVITVAVPFLAKQAISFFSAQTQRVKSEYIQGVLRRAIELAGQKVLMMEQTVISELKKQLASGKITKEQLPAVLEGVKNSTLEAVKRDAKAQGLWSQLDKVFNGHPGELDAWLNDVIESQVAQLQEAKLGSIKELPPAIAKLMPASMSVPTPQ